VKSVLEAYLTTPTLSLTRFFPTPPSLLGLKLQKDREVVEMVNNRITHAAVEISAELVRHNKRIMVRVGLARQRTG
jgi:hypothetical protein